MTPKGKTREKVFSYRCPYPVSNPYILFPLTPRGNELDSFISLLSYTNDDCYMCSFTLDFYFTINSRNYSLFVYINQILLFFTFLLLPPPLSFTVTQQPILYISRVYWTKLLFMKIHRITSVLQLAMPQQVALSIWILCTISGQPSV